MDAVRSGMMYEDVVRQFRVSNSTILRWVRRLRDSGTHAALPIGGKKPFVLADEKDWLVERFAAKPDLILRELLAELHDRDIMVSLYALWHIAHRAELALKKTLHASEQDHPDIAHRRSWWRRWLQRLIDGKRLVFIDETWIKINMTRLRGWCQAGQRLVVKVPHGHWKTLTLVAALRHDSVIAPWVVDGPINAESFLIYVSDVLVPTLQLGNIVVLDNLSSHKDSKIKETIQAAGAKMIFLPAYSPDLNPIEQVFSEIKALTRK